MGAQGPTAMGGRWTQYRDFVFRPGSETLVYADGAKAGEVADYMRRNPSHRVGIDGYSDRKVASVRNALIDAGVPADRIQAGAFADPQRRSESRVIVLVAA